MAELEFTKMNTDELIARVLSTIVQQQVYGMTTGLELLYFATNSKMMHILWLN